MINLFKEIEKRIDLEVEVINWKHKNIDELYEVNNYKKYCNGEELTIKELIDLLQDLQNYIEGK